MPESSDREENRILDQIRSEKTRSFSLADAFRVGYLLESLAQLVDDNAPVYEYPEMDRDTRPIIGVLDEIATTLAESDIQSTIKNDIQSKGIDIVTTYSRSNPTGQSSASEITLRTEDQRQLYGAVTTWKRVFERELESEKRIAISESLLDVDTLIDDTSSLFEERYIWESLSDTTQSDLTEACRALACQCPTASVFMSLRAVEECLRQWYKTQTGREIEQRTFGQVLGELDDTYNGDDDSRPAVLSNLDFLNDRRNEVGHPDRLPDMEEAENTIMTVRGTMSGIYEEMEGD